MRKLEVIYNFGKERFGVMENGIMKGFPTHATEKKG